MNKYNPKYHHRRSIRLKGYDKLNGGNGNIVMESGVEYNSEIWMV